MKFVAKASLLLAFAGLAGLADGGTIITDNLPAGTAIVNIDSRQDGAATYTGPASLWYHPINASGGALLQYTVPPGTYSFRVINPADAAVAFPALTTAQTNQIYSAWTYNSPWITDYIVFDGAAATDYSISQLFDGSPDPTSYGDPVSAYNGAVAGGYTDKIRTNPAGRVGNDFTNRYTFTKTTTLIFAIADYGLYDNAGGVSVVVASVAPAASNYAVDWFSADGGGGAFGSTGSYNVSGTIGQPDAGWINDPCVSCLGGFWAAALPDTPIPAPGPTADLAVSATDLPGYFSIGATLTYTIMVTNSGGTTATGVLVTNQLPAGLNFVSAASARSVNASGGKVVMDLGTLVAGGCASATIVVTASANGYLTNVIQVSANQTDLNPANNRVSEIVAVNPFAVDWYSADGGGAMFAGAGSYEVSGTIGQPDAGGSRGGAYFVEGGFWGLIATAPPSPAPVPSGIVSWWRAENNALDSISVNHGSLHGNATYATGEVGKAFSFDGMDDGVTIGNPSNLQLQTFTIESWVKRASASAVTLDTPNASFPDGAIFGYGLNGYGFGLRQAGTNAVLILTKVGVSSIDSGILQLTDLNFHHVAVTTSDGMVTFYIDGVASTPQAYAPGFAFTSNAAIGSRGDIFQNTLLGMVDELTIYGRALSTAEIQTIYNAGTAGKNSDTPSISAPLALPAGTVGVPYLQSLTAMHGTAPYAFTVVSGELPPGLTLSGNVIGGTPGAAGVNTTSTITVRVTDNAGTYSERQFALVVSTSPVLPAGIVSWWRAENNALDSIGVNHGTLEGGVTFTSGEVARAFVFDGATADVKIPTAGSLNVGAGNGLSIELWISPSNLNERTLVEWNSGQPGGGIAGIIGAHFNVSVVSQGAAPGNLYANLVDINGIDHRIQSSGGLIAPNTLQHAAVTYDKSSGLATIYLNGLPIAGPSNLGIFTPQTSYDLYFGSRPSGAGANRYAGIMDEISLYNRALAAAEIQAIYAVGNTGKAVPELALTRSGSQVVVSWPASLTDFALQVSPNAGPGTSWLNVTALPAFIGGQSVLTNDASIGHQFFRLYRP